MNTSSAKASGPHVLVVDDDDDIRESVVAVLEDEGYHVEQARNGQEAVSQLEEHERPSVVLLDLMMPVMDGWEVIGVMRSDDFLASIPVVVTSATADRPPAGAVRLLKKPVSVAALLAAVKEHCH